MTPHEPSSPSPRLARAPAADDQSPRKIREMFTAITPAYDRLNRLFSGWLDQRWRRLAARAALEGLTPCRRALDVATGTGDLAEALDRAARRLHPGAGTRVTGADFTRSMVRRAGVKFGHRAMGWIEADGLRLPLCAASFDACTIAFGLRNMVDRPAGLREMARVLRPGGRLVILEFGKPRNRVVRWGYDLYSFRIMPRVGAWLSRSEAYRYLPTSIREFWNEAELSDRMRQAGFEAVTARRLMFGIVIMHCGRKRG
jgi:demethylmenaquinone methyltransferase/2-methoxy-6-polyprenyl-1,4-benzoquinol methylase